MKFKQMKRFSMSSKRKGGLIKKFLNVWNGVEAENTFKEMFGEKKCLGEKPSKFVENWDSRSFREYKHKKYEFNCTEAHNTKNAQKQ